MNKMPNPGIEKTGLGLESLIVECMCCCYLILDLLSYVIEIVLLLAK